MPLTICLGPLHVCRTKSYRGTSALVSGLYPAPFRGFIMPAFRQRSSLVASRAAQCPLPVRAGGFCKSLVALCRSFALCERQTLNLTGGLQ